MRIQTALITGASSGIGEELAELFARDKTDLILVARSGDKLEALAARLRQAHGIAAHVITCDLSQPGASQKLFEQVADLRLTVECSSTTLASVGWGTSIRCRCRHTPT